jgi:DNA (cytosine-5)-methyltransferase 1
MSWEEPSLTLTCSPAQNQTERCHPDETRPFKVREYARIQTFPDDWKFAGSVSNQYKQIGNAVPVKLAKEVGYSIVRFLNEAYNSYGLQEKVVNINQSKLEFTQLEFFEFLYKNASFRLKMKNGVFGFYIR